MENKNRATRKKIEKSRPTIVDVARLAGVSTGTVTRVLAGATNVKKANLENVLAATKKLNYRINYLAKALRGTQSRSFGLVIHHVNAMFVGETIARIIRNASDMGFQVITTIADLAIDDVKKQLDLLRERMVEGIFMQVDPSPGLITPLHDLFKDNIPLVLLNQDPNNPFNRTMDYTGNNILAGGMLAMNHLLEQGHRRIGFVRFESYVSLGRHQAYARALGQAGIPFDDTLVLHMDEADIATSGYVAAKKFLEMPDRPTAIFSGNDQCALGLISGLSEAGVRIPEDISVMGFDDIPAARHFTPSLSTVRLNLDDQCAQAMDIMRERLSDGLTEKPIHRITAPELVIRKSTAPV